MGLQPLDWLHLRLPLPLLTPWMMVMMTWAVMPIIKIDLMGYFAKNSSSWNIMRLRRAS